MWIFKCVLLWIRPFSDFCGWFIMIHANYCNASLKCLFKAVKHKLKLLIRTNSNSIVKQDCPDGLWDRLWGLNSSVKDGDSPLNGCPHPQEFITPIRVFSSRTYNLSPDEQFSWLMGNKCLSISHHFPLMICTCTASQAALTDRRGIIQTQFSLCY